MLKATGFNRGVGIHVFNTMGELFRLLKEYAEMQGPHQTQQMFKCLQTITKHIGKNEPIPDEDTNQADEGYQQSPVKSCSFII